MTISKVWTKLSGSLGLLSIGLTCFYDIIHFIRLTIIDLTLYCVITKLKALSKNDTFMRYLKNSSWMIAENALRIISAIFVSIYVARYLGPERFGVLNYAFALVSIFMAASRLGMESILVRDLVKYPKQAKAYMGTAFGLMAMAAIAGYLVLSALIYFLESDLQTKTYVWIIASGLVFQTFLVIDYSFQAQIKAKYPSIAKSLALVISSGIKIYLVWEQAELLFFALAYAFDQFVIAFMLLAMHLVKRQNGFVFGFKKSLIRPLLSSAWPMVLSAVASILYMRIDQVMIKNMLDSHELGLYSAATKIYEGWIIVPYIVSTSLLPAIVKLKSTAPESYEINLTRLFALVFWPGVIIAGAATFGGKWIVQHTFGEAFVESSSVLGIVMWTAAFTAMGSITARYLTVEGMEKKIALRTFLALIINVSLNLILIPQYGINGSAIATLSTIIIANYFINYTDKDLKQLLKICNNAITLNLFKTKKKNDIDG